MKTELATIASWQGRWYGPGEVEIPDELAIALGLLTEDEVEEKTPAVIPSLPIELGAIADLDEPTILDPPIIPPSKRPSKRKS